MSRTVSGHVKRCARTPASQYWKLLHTNECFYCGEEVIGILPNDNGKNQRDNFKTYDHIIPRSKGGSVSYKNLVVCCNRCNHKRDDMDFIKFGIASFLNRKLKACKWHE